MRLKRIVLIVAIVIIGLIMIDSGVRIAGFLNTVSTGLTIHTSAHEATIEAPGEVSFEYTALSPLFCSAECEATLIRHDTNQAIAQSSELNALSSNTISATIEDESSLKRVPIQLTLTCKTRQTRYCSASEQVTADIAIARFSLGEEDARIRAQLIERKETIEEELAYRRALLEELASLEEPYTHIAQQAAEQREEYALEIEAYLEDIAHERYRQPPRTTRAIELWNEEASSLDEARTRSGTVAELITVLGAYRSIFGSDLAGFENLTHTYRELEAAPTRANTILENMNEQLERVASVYRSSILTAAWNSAQRTHHQLNTSCAVHYTDCPEPIERPATLEEAYALNQELCTIASEHNSRDPRTRIAAALNLTVQDALEAYNVTALQNEEGFASFERDVLENSSLADNLTTAQRLAIRIPVTASHCSDRIEPAVFELPDLEPSPESITIEMVGERTCSFGSCVQHESTPPILFIHGHSFAQSSDPRYNLQGMTRLASAFEKHGYLYAGHLFPTSTRGIGPIDAPVSFTATYYVNSYEEDGEIKLSTFKSEPIESYAVRLRDDIEEAKQATGSENVVLVAHSMGGLVARSYLDLFGSESVERLIMIATPNHGITDRIQQICPLLGANIECRDMTQGSVFLRRLNAQPLPDIPIRIIAGTGCDEGDGIVPLENVLLGGVNITIVHGTCSGIQTLHSGLVDPRVKPEVLDVIATDVGR